MGGGQCSLKEETEKVKQGRRESRQEGKYYSSDRHSAASWGICSVTQDNCRDASYTATFQDSRENGEEKEKSSPADSCFLSPIGVDSPKIPGYIIQLLTAATGAHGPCKYCISPAGIQQSGLSCPAGTTLQRLPIAGDWWWWRQQQPGPPPWGLNKWFEASFLSKQG